MAQKAGLSEKEFRHYNPAIRSGFVPSKRYGCSIRLPVDNAQALISSMDTLKKSAVSDYFVYYIKKGDNLSSLAQYYGVSLASLMAINNIRNPNWIREGQRLYIPTAYRAARTNSETPTRHQWSW